MQPPPCLKIWRVVPSIVLYSGHEVNFFATYLQFYFSALLQTGCLFWIFVFCTGFLIFALSFRSVLWSNYNVVDPSPAFSYNIKLCSCNKVINWLHGEIPEGFPSSPANKREGRLYLSSDWVYWYTIQSVIINFTMLKGIFNVWSCPSSWGIGKLPWSCVGQWQNKSTFNQFYIQNV